MERGINFLLYFLFVGTAMAASRISEGEQEKVPLTRVRRGLINVPKQESDLHRLTNEFGERGLQDEDMEALMAEDMSFSYEDMSFSYEMSMGYEEDGKGKKKGKRSRAF